jgi:MraZ protein
MAFRGQYDCTMDDKGRIKMPAALRKQFPAEEKGAFMIAKDIEDCLVIYPMKEWEEQEAKLMKLNQFDPALRQFASAMMIGLTEVQFDNADRFLVQRSLTKYLGGSKDVVLLGRFNRIQIWDAAKLEQYNNGGLANIKELAQEAASYIDKLEAKEKQ